MYYWTRALNSPQGQQRARQLICNEQKSFKINKNAVIVLTLKSFEEKKQKISLYFTLYNTVNSTWIYKK